MRLVATTIGLQTKESPSTRFRETYRGEQDGLPQCAGNTGFPQRDRACAASTFQKIATSSAQGSRKNLALDRSLKNSSWTQYQRFSATSLRHQLVTVEPSRRGDAKILLTKPSLQARRRMSPVQSWIQVRIPTQLEMKALIKSGGRFLWTSVDFRQKLHRVRKRFPPRSKRRGSKRARSQCRPR